MVLKHGPMPSVGPDTIVDIWMNSTDARRVLDKGFRIVHAPADYFYLVNRRVAQAYGVDGS